MRRCLAALFFLAFLSASGQQAVNPELIQISGIIVTADSLRPIPFVNILIKNSYRGVVSDYYGFFSIVARQKDTLEFSSIGFTKAYFIIPDTLTEQRYSLIQILRSDTIMLPEALIYPWPTKEQFKEAFIRLHVPGDDLDRAKRNLDKYNLALIGENMPMDGTMNYREQMKYRSNEFYSSGQLPPYTILDPIAWGKFIDMWKSGAFKKKDKKLKDED
jgi:hypothetical protein